MAQPKARACFFASKKLAQLLPMIQREFQRGKHGIRQQGLVPRLVAKKTGYVKRAGFRMSEADRLKAKRAAEWRAVFIKFGTLVAIVVALIVAKRLLY